MALIEVRYANGRIRCIDPERYDELAGAAASDVDIAFDDMEEGLWAYLRHYRIERIDPGVLDAAPDPDGAACILAADARILIAGPGELAEIEEVCCQGRAMLCRLDPDGPLVPLTRIYALARVWLPDQRERGIRELVAELADALSLAADPDAEDDDPEPSLDQLSARLGIPPDTLASCLTYRLP